MAITTGTGMARRGRAPAGGSVMMKHGVVSVSVSRRGLRFRPYPDAVDERFSVLPGADLVDRGTRDLAAGGRTIEALLVSRATARLRSSGVSVAEPLPDADRELYRLLCDRDGNGAHGAYNALTRRLVSFMHAAEHHAP